jgi:hypothetical protein
MAASHSDPPPPTAPDGSGPFDPFTLEPQKAHSSTGSGASPPMQHAGSRRFRIPPAFLALLLALVVAVPTVVSTLSPTGQAPSDGGSAPSVGSEAPADGADDEGGGTGSPALPPTEGREPAQPSLPDAQEQELPDPAPPPPAEPPTAEPESQQLRAVEDCVASLPALRASCEIVLGEDSGAAASYLECRELGAAADRCLPTLRDE